ncbi:MAG: hypothetical protein NVS1B10_00620 [Candidatus Saccharimonadales bacterium]
MVNNIFEKFWHRSLKRPYRLAAVIDEGAGPAVVLLHGIGRTGDTWQHVISRLDPLVCRSIAFDLLGFGASPKPDWIDYSIDDHARALIATLTRKKIKQPVIIVGHSMGCLVAVRVARLRPDLVRHMVLYEMPLYEGLPNKRSYRLRLALYSRFYNKVVAYQPTFDDKTRRLSEKLGRRIVGFEVTPETWTPFVRSLQNSILKQTAADDIKHINIAMDVIYGSLDMLVIKGKTSQIFGTNDNGLNAYTIRARHSISIKASQFIVERIKAVLAKERGTNI